MTNKNKSNKLEKLFLQRLFKNLNREIICPIENCREYGTHFRCYDSTYEKCHLNQKNKKSG